MKQDSIFNNYNNIEETLGNEKANQPLNNISNNTEGKETISVFVITGKKEEHADVTYKKVINGKVQYSGIMWDILEEVKKEPEMDKYNFEYTFSKEGYSNFSETIEWISEGKYDLGLASYVQTVERDSKVEYVTPLLIDANTVVHIKKTDKYEVFKDIFYDLTKLILILILLGVITGLLLFTLDPKRNGVLDRKNSKKQFFLRSILTGIATFFGEAGFLFENSTPTLKGLIVITIAMSFATIFLLYLQGEITSDIIERKMGVKLQKEDLAKKPILGHEGYAVSDNLKNMGANIKYFKDKTNKELLELYLQNPEKYNGVALTYCDGFPLFKKNSQLTTSLFGNIPTSLVYCRNKLEFGRKLDKSLLKLRAEGRLKKICHSYFGDIKNVPVCSL